VKLLLTAFLFLAAASCYGASPQAANSQPPGQSAPAAARPQTPAAPQAPAQSLETRRMEYDLNTLRSMLYQMKSDLSRVQDPAARSALLVDSQMWEWLIADMQRRANAMRTPAAMPPPAPPVRPEPQMPRGVRDPNQ
jgi:hypothetical protein